MTESRFRRAWPYLRSPARVLLALAMLDCLAWAFAGTWDRHSPDDYTARVNRFAERPRDFVFVGGSTVSEGIDPAAVAGFRRGNVAFTDGFAVGLPGGTTSEFFHAVKYACPTPPRLLVYGITASDLNDSRNEPHGPQSIMGWRDVRDWATARPDSREWVVRQYVLGKLSRASSLYHHRHGIRMWAARASGIDAPATAAEAKRLRDYATALHTGNGYAPDAGFVNQRYDAVKEANAPLPPFAFLDRYKTGAHLAYLYKLIDWAADRGVELVLLDMPVTADLEAKHAAAFAEYRALLADLERRHGLTVIRAHRDVVGITEAGFADTIHLNRTGCAVLSAWVRTKLDDGGRDTTPAVARAQAGGAAP